MRTTWPLILGTIALSMLLVLSACHPEKQTVLPGTETNKPPEKDTIATKPNNHDSVSVFKRVVISWAPSDFVELIMDGGNNPLRYTTQFLYEQGTDKVRMVKHDFMYGPNQQLTRLKLDNGFYVTYTYEAGRIVRTDQYGSIGNLIATRHYEYGAANQLIGIQQFQVVGQEKIGMRYQFIYTDGNLSEIRQTNQDSQTGQYSHSVSTRFSMYDQQKNVENLQTIYPYLPGVTFSKNNPRLITFHDEQGNEITTARKQFEYTYNAQGYVVTRTESGAGSTLKSTYSYSGF